MTLIMTTTTSSAAEAAAITKDVENLKMDICKSETERSDNDDYLPEIVQQDKEGCVVAQPFAKVSASTQNNTMSQEEEEDDDYRSLDSDNHFGHESTDDDDDYEAGYGNKRNLYSEIYDEPNKSSSKEPQPKKLDNDNDSSDVLQFRNKLSKQESYKLKSDFRLNAPVPDNDSGFIDNDDDDDNVDDITDDNNNNNDQLAASRNLQDIQELQEYGFVPTSFTQNFNNNDIDDDNNNNNDNSFSSSTSGKRRTDSFASMGDFFERVLFRPIGSVIHRLSIRPSVATGGTFAANHSQSTAAIAAAQAMIQQHELFGKTSDYFDRERQNNHQRQQQLLQQQHQLQQQYGNTTTAATLAATATAATTTTTMDDKVLFRRVAYCLMTTILILVVVLIVLIFTFSK